MLADKNNDLSRFNQWRIIRALSLFIVFYTQTRACFARRYFMTHIVIPFTKYSAKSYHWSAYDFSISFPKILKNAKKEVFFNEIRDNFTFPLLFPGNSQKYVIFLDQTRVILSNYRFSWASEFRSGIWLFEERREIELDQWRVLDGQRKRPIHSFDQCKRRGSNGIGKGGERLKDKEKERDRERRRNSVGLVEKERDLSQYQRSARALFLP